MSRTVILPPAEPLRPEGGKVGGWWHSRADGRVVCDLCPRGCTLKEGDRGFCFVRQNQGGEVVLTTYGRSTGFCIDPIEKKPLHHFYPGTSVFSFGTAGCCLACKFCQNWSTTKSREEECASDLAGPEAIAVAARRHGCRSVAFTYNDPIIWAEYALDTAHACREQGIKTVAKTSGFISPAARPTFFGAMDAANVDLKALSEDFYQHFTLSHMQPVLDTLCWIQQESPVWLEITNLLIPGGNDAPDAIARLCGWVLEHLGAEVPIHFTAFRPDFRLRDRPPTPAATLEQARDMALAAGLRYVYTGNVHDPAGQATYCPGCGACLIARDGYRVTAYRLCNGSCGVCGRALAGHFDAAAGTWGSRRRPIVP